MYEERMATMSLYLLFPAFTMFFALALIATVPREEILRLSFYGIIFGGMADILVHSFGYFTGLFAWINYGPFGFIGVHLFSSISWSIFFILFYYFMPKKKPFNYLFVCAGIFASFLYYNLVLDLGIFQAQSRFLLPLFGFGAWFIVATWGFYQLKYLIEGKKNLALDAIKLVFGYLPRAYENGNDLEAREKMMFANIMAGMAFNHAGLGYVHALAHQLGGFYEYPHGCSTAVLLPYVFDFNSVSVPEEKILKICEAMGISAANRINAVDSVMDSIKNLSANIGIPAKLSEIGLKIEDIETISKNALKDISSFTNPRQGNLEDMSKILHAAF
ncbi:MAG: iron-containing alcohol dehydrogenase [Peptococcaceae bacterium]|nr:iron-containing alcohol dehydrogenase [Peptococcaceae bacterium]